MTKASERNTSPSYFVTSDWCMYRVAFCAVTYGKMAGLVNDNEGCLDLVEDAMRLLESRNYDRLRVTPRKSLEVPVIVACSPAKGRIQYYFPRKDRWYSLGEMPFSFVSSYLVGSCHGKIYGIQYEFASYRHRMASFNPYTNKWMLLPSNEDRDLKQIFVANEDKMYALVSKPCENHRQHPSYSLDTEVHVQFCVKNKHVSFITKYKPESNSWENISSFDHMNLRENVCIVSKDNFVYFVGGEEDRYTGYNFEFEYKCLADVERYDLRKNRWDKVADIQIARSSATGAAANGKIVIAGGNRTTKWWSSSAEELQCEVFSETTNEWQFIETCDMHPRSILKLLSVDDRLYVLANSTRPLCYDPDKNEWSQKTQIPEKGGHAFKFCSMRIFKGFLDSKGAREVKWRTTSSSAQSSRADASSCDQAGNLQGTGIRMRSLDNCLSTTASEVKILMTLSDHLP